MEFPLSLPEGGRHERYRGQQEDRRPVDPAAVSHGDLGAIDDYLSEEFVMHDPPFGSSPDRDGMRSTAADVRAEVPDWRSELHLLVAEDDLVAEVFTASGTHHGEIMGVAPTGRRMSLRGINVFRLRDGRITEWWSRLDELGFLQQLGVMPSIGT
jgi:steroid delta-isomerase-like uncharacterized protein